MAPIYLGASAATLPADLSAFLGSLPVHSAGEPWPADAVALWLLFGQSNAQGRAPRSQDPAKANAADAVDFFAGLPLDAALYEGPSPWWRVSRPAITTQSAINGRLEGLSLAGANPTTSSHAYGASPGFGIPANEKAFGLEIGLARHVLEGGAPATWRNDADPRLFILKPTNGGTSVDQFREGGDLNDFVMGHLTQTEALNLNALAATKTVLLQGAVFVIGERDQINESAGDVEAGSFRRRIGEWVRQVRGLLGHADLPAVMVEIYDNAGALAGAAGINAQLAQAAADVGNAAVIDSAPHGVADSVHFDAAAMDAIGEAVFRTLRERPEARADGLITTRPYAGALQPVLTLPPVWQRHNSGTQTTFKVRASVDGTLYLATLASPPADAAAVKAAAHVSAPLVANADAEIVGNGFTGGESQTYATVEAAGGVFAPVVNVPRNSNPGKFIVSLPSGLTGGAGGISGDLRVGTGGAIHWVVHPQTIPNIAAADVTDRAFLPVASGVDPIAAANVAQAFSVSGLPAGDYALFVVPVAGSGAIGETWRVDFTAT
ncbi:MAG: sialate O-acetylesterase [Pseudomonadota bacterium]